MGVITCPDCGRQISDRAPKCIHCGCPSTEFNAPKTISCPECGESIDSNNAKCPNCGFPIEKEKKTQEKKKRDSTVIIYGYKEVYADYPVISIYKDEEHIGDVGYNDIFTVSISSDCDLIFKCNSVSETVHVRKEVDSQLYLSYHNYPAEINVTKIENEIDDEEEELFCTNCGTPVTGNETFCPNCGCQFVCDQVDCSSSDTHWGHNWQRIIQVFFPLLCAVYGFLTITGATGDENEFARKYALKYGYNYSDVNRGIYRDPNIFPYPHSTFYFRLEDGSKKNVGSCAFWIYSIKDDEDSSMGNDKKNITKEILMEAILKKGSFNSNLGPVYPKSNWTVVSGGEYVGDINIIEMKGREATIDIVLHYTGMYIGKLTYRLNSDGSWDSISEKYGNSN